MLLLSHPLYRLAPLVACSAAYSFAVNGGIINGFELANFAAGYGPAYYVVLWVVQDARRTRYWPAYHYPLWLLSAGVVLVPHYVLRTRGWSAIGLAALLSLATWTPAIAGLLGWWFYDDLPDFR